MCKNNFLPENQSIDRSTVLRTEIDQQKRRLDEKDRQSTVLSHQIAQLSEKLELKRLKRLLQAKEAEIEKLDQKINSLISTQPKEDVKKPNFETCQVYNIINNFFGTGPVEVLLGPKND